MPLRRIIPLFLLLATVSGGCLYVDRNHDGWRDDGWRDNGWQRERRQDWRDYRQQRRWWWLRDRDRDHQHDDD